MRFTVEVSWGPEGALVGRVAQEGARRADPFWGVAELVGLLQAALAPAGKGKDKTEGRS